MTWNTIKSSILIAVLFGAPNALGCAVCGFGDDGTREAFLLTTALLTLVPLAMIGGGVYYLTRVARRAEHDLKKSPETSRI